MRLIYFIFLLIIGLSCSIKTVIYKPLIFNWEQVTSTNKFISSCKIDSVNNNYIIAVSYPQSGYKIEIINNFLNKKNTIISKGKGYGIRYFYTKDSLIGLIESQFNYGTKVSSQEFKISRDLGKSWIILNDTLDVLRKFIITDSVIIIQGIHNGISYILKSTDTAKTWTPFEYLNTKGYKSVDIINDKEIGGKLMIIGSKTYLLKDAELVFWDYKNDSLNKIFNFDGNTSNTKYLKIISKKSFELHAIQDESKIKIYSFKNNTVKYEYSFETPKEIGTVVKNLYVNHDYMIITGTMGEYENIKTLSWYSHDKGENWFPFEHENEYKLIYNPFGGLFVLDTYNNVYKGF